MHVLDNLKNFLYDNDNFIALFNNKIYLYNITRIDTINSNIIIVIFDDKKIIIEGNNLKPLRSTCKEILIDGLIERVSINE